MSLTLTQIKGRMWYLLSTFDGNLIWPQDYKMSIRYFYRLVRIPGIAQTKSVVEFEIDKSAAGY